MEGTHTPATTPKCCFPRCPHDAWDNKNYCIFHLPVDQKDPAEFWKHLASYICALLQRSGTSATIRWADKHPTHWVFSTRTAELQKHYASLEKSGDWSFSHFRFCSMSNQGTLPITHTFDDFVFARVWFWGAEFAGKASFNGARFTRDAFFTGAVFNDEAYFAEAVFSGNADFSNCRFLGGETGLPVSHRVSACFPHASFEADANFSYAFFRHPLSLAQARFAERVDFYEARIPGLSHYDDERTARYVRQLAERFGAYADAGDIYIIEMDFRRKRFVWPERFFTRLVLELYHKVSRYGESPVRALFWLLAVISAFAVPYLNFGFWIQGNAVRRSLPLDLSQFWPTLRDYGLAVVYAFANVVPGYFRFQSISAGCLETSILSIVQAILSAIILALFLLALRRRFSR